MSQKRWMMLALTSVLGLGCGAEYAPLSDESAEAFGSAEAAVAACEGDDLQYDFNAFSASLAVAIANELGRWDVLGDFEIRNGKLELSKTGLLHCGTSGCQNITALLRLQDDATAGVPYHSPSIYRSKLSGWYTAQKTKLTELATASSQAPGTYRIVSRMAPSKRLTVDNGSSADNARVEIWDTAQTGADQWKVQVSGSGHKLVNVRSGKCLDLSSNSSQLGMQYVQRSCSSSDTQLFKFQDIDQGFVGILNKFGKAAEVKWWSSNNDTPIVTANWIQYETNKAWKLEAVSGGSSTSTGLPDGMYTLTAKHSGKTLVVDGGLTNGSPITQRSYDANNDGFHWYLSKVGDRHQLVNRRTGMCMAFLGTTNESAVGQRTCANVDTQKFTVERIVNDGEERYGVRGPSGTMLMVKDYSTTDGAALVVASGGQPRDMESRQFKFQAIVAGEPHRLTYSHTTDDAPCGDYQWYEIRQPNGLTLTNPEETFVQLMFAGGKTSLTGRDENPFIAQQVSGTLVAIDPSGYMLPNQSANSGSCVASDLLYDSTKSANGKCCIKYNGVSGMLRASSWSSTTFLCK